MHAAWEVPVHDERRHFEFLLLEGAQAGLSWDAILRKREEYRQAFDHFNPVLVAGYGPAKVADLCQYAGIVRNRLKFESAIRLTP
ncbi:MAG: DNA-3-methyladenine glycosylase I [Magnetococcus sp. YQC-3]